MLLPLMVFGQSKTETITKSFQLTDTSKELWFCVCNIEGDVSVDIYDITQDPVILPAVNPATPILTNILASKS